jgi:hypothetical protein
MLKMAEYVLDSRNWWSTSLCVGSGAKNFDSRLQIIML